MNIYIQELKMSFKSMIFWTLGVTLFVFAYMFMFPAISENASKMDNYLNSLPEGIRKALGLTSLKLSDIIGFYGYLFTYVLLIGSIYAMKSGLSILSEEIRSKTADFLITKPVSRTTIVTAKLLHTITNLAIQNAVFISTSFFVLSYFKKAPFSMKTFLLVSFSLIFVQLFFIAFGLILSVVLKKIKSVLPISLGVVFFFFIIQMVNQTLDDPKLAYLTPFAYFDIPKIVHNGSYNISLLVTNFALITVFIFLSYIIYNKKNMPSV